MYKLLLILTINLFLFVEVYSQNDSVYNYSSESIAKTITSDFTVFVPSFILLITVHELGHCTFASIFGSEDVSFKLYQKKPKGFSIGVTSYDPSNFSRKEIEITNLGGIIFTRGFSEIADFTLNKTNLHKFGQKFISMTYFLTRIDFSSYVLRNMLFAKNNPSGQDIEQFVVSVSERKNMSRIGVYGILMTIAGLDLYFDRNRIHKHLRVLGGKDFRNIKKDNIKFNCWYNSQSFNASLLVSF